MPLENPYVFPWDGQVGAGGMRLRDYFAAHAPDPSPEAVQLEAERDRLRNPHGDSYKPPRRSVMRIVTELRYRYADAMLAARIPTKET